MKEIRTAHLEPTELIARDRAADRHRVPENAFAFERGEPTCMPPEITAPVISCLPRHHLDQKAGPSDCLHWALLRAESPAKGRTVSSPASGARVIGSPDPRPMQRYCRYDGGLPVVRFSGYHAAPEYIGDARSRSTLREALRAYLEPMPGNCRKPAGNDCGQPPPNPR